MRLYGHPGHVPQSCIFAEPLAGNGELSRLKLSRLNKTQAGISGLDYANVLQGAYRSVDSAKTKTRSNGGRADCIGNAKGHSDHDSLEHSRKET